MSQKQRERLLRQQIHGLRVKKFNWPLEGFQYIMNAMGYGDSLQALSEDRLLELKAIMVNYRKHGRPPEYTYDKQGMFMFAMMKHAGWTESQLRAYTIQHFQKSHWNLLNAKERRAIIAMLHSYIIKQMVDQHNVNNPKEDSNE